jgi:transcriptional regulator with PAS, ATPase and Fis domain
MQASLIVREGKRQFTYEIRKEQTVVGREPGADVIVSDPSCSRRHAVVLLLPEDKAVIKDLDSRNGTLVNGAKVKEKELQWGDRITVGLMNLVYVCREGDDASPEKKSGKTGMFRAKTMGVNVNDLDLSFVKRPRAAHINAFYQIAAVLPLYRDADRAGDALLELLLSVFKASRAAILVFGDENRLLAQVQKRLAQEEYGENIDFREDILKLVFSTGRAFLQDEESCAVYVPILHEGKAIGALYLDTVQQSTRLTEDDLWVMAGIAVQYAVILQDLRYREKLEREKVALEESSAAEETVVGESPAMKEVMRLAVQAAATDDPASLLGESGTGKELVARAIHHAGRRRAGPFVAVNCAGVDPSLLESALFGHEKGALPGQDAAQKGALERAHGGTVFLDEVGSLEDGLQRKLLDYLSSRTLRRLGASVDLSVDSRLIVGSSLPLEALVAGETFRADLLARLGSVAVRIPALKDRPEDIPLLALHFVRKYGSKIGKRLEGIDPEAMQALSRHSWPGNVRELENLIERAVILAQGPTIGPSELRGL